MANLNNKLCKTQTVEIRIDTGEHQVIKMKPYWTLIYKREHQVQARKSGRSK